MCYVKRVVKYDQNTQFHSAKQKSSTPWDLGHPPPPPRPSEPSGASSLAGGFQEIWNAPYTSRSLNPATGACTLYFLP